MSTYASYLETLTRRLTQTDALVKGYFIVAFEGTELIFPKLDPYLISLIYNKYITSVGLPESSLRTSNFVGRMGHSREVPSGVARGNRIQLEGLLTQSMELISIHNTWFNYVDAMFSSIYGGYSPELAIEASTGNATDNNLRSSRHYSAVFHYWLLNPSMEVVSCFMGYGMQPQKLISDELGSSLTVETLKVSLQYKIDYWLVYTPWDNPSLYKKVNNGIMGKIYNKLKEGTDKALEEKRKG